MGASTSLNSDTNSTTGVLELHTRTTSPSRPDSRRPASSTSSPMPMLVKKQGVFLEQTPFDLYEELRRGGGAGRDRRRGFDGRAVPAGWGDVPGPRPPPAVPQPCGADHGGLRCPLPAGLRQGSRSRHRPRPIRRIHREDRLPSPGRPSRAPRLIRSSASPSKYAPTDGPPPPDRVDHHARMLKNQVDSDKIAPRWIGQAGLCGCRWIRRPADVVMVNTCGFIDAAGEDPSETILGSGRGQALRCEARRHGMHGPAVRAGTDRSSSPRPMRGDRVGPIPRARR